jgi:hypothetical protein
MNLTNSYVLMGRYVELPQIAVSIQMDLAHFLVSEVMHDKQAFGVSLFLISGTGMTWHGRNCSCIFEILGYLLDLILFSCFVSRLFAFSSFGFVFSVSQSLDLCHANTSFSEIRIFFGFLCCRGMFSCFCLLFLSK